MAATSVCGFAELAATSLDAARSLLTIGEVPPFFNFRVITEAQSSAVVNRRFDMRVLIGVNDFTGCSEVGSLFVRPEHRVGGIGRALAQCRYMLMAVAPQRFRDQVVSELRGVVSPEGVSPFWEAVGRHFFRMDFAEADKLSAITDKAGGEPKPADPQEAPKDDAPPSPSKDLGDPVTIDGAAQAGTDAFGIQAGRGGGRGNIACRGGRGAP